MRSLWPISGALRAVVGWLRAGYSDEAPAQGHSALMALNGPIALSPKQTARIVTDLEGRPTDHLEINVAITKVTDRLPTPTQVSRIAHALRPQVRHTANWTARQ